MSILRSVFCRTFSLVAILTLGVCLRVNADTVAGNIADTFDLRPFHATDSLAPRDEWGVLHRMPSPESTDFARRYPWRPLYWLEGKNDLVRQPAYVAAAQRDLARLGYYCGPIDGIYSDEVSYAIAKLQKNYSMRVTGTLTIAVRRALHLP